MRFRFRLAPLLKVAERDLVSKQNILNQLQQEQNELEACQQSLRMRLAEQESGVSALNDGGQAVYFYQRRTSIHREIQGLQEQREHLEKLKEACLLEISAAKREVYRLELIRDKSKAEFRAEQQREEDKNLDEIGTLRHGRKKLRRS